MYSQAEVARLINNYEHLKAVADTDRRGMRFLLLVADIDKALDKLDAGSWEVVLLCGLLGIHHEAAAELLETSRRSVSRRYTDALDDMHFYINGGIDD